MNNILTRTIEGVPSQLTLMDGLFFNYYRPMIKRELLMIDADVKSVLFIGGGAAPYSAWLIHDILTRNVTIIDNSFKRTQGAHRFLATRDLEMKMDLCDGANADMGCYDLIIIAKQVVPKQDVLDHIWRHAHVGTHVLLRIGRGETPPSSPVNSVCHPFRKTMKTNHYIVS